MSNTSIVTTQSELAGLCESWRAAGRLAFDTEFIRDETFDASLCLVQVAAEGEVVLVDPTVGLDMAPFWDLVADPDVLSVVHAGKEDFEICLRATGRPPQNVFDVQIAAGFVGYGYPLSLTRLVDAVRRRRIAKAQTMTDWARRPLTDEQIRYAVDDVLHLPAIHEKLAALLEEHGRTEWAAEEFARFEDPQLYEPPASERVFKIKGARKLDSLGLAVLARLIDWRDDWARSRNRPIRALMRDDVLVEIARRRPTKPSQLEVLRGFPQSRNREVVRGLLKAIDETTRTPESEWPTPPPVRDETPMMRVATDMLSAVMRSVCHEQGVAQDLVGAAQRLRELVDFSLEPSKPQPILLTGWREHFVGRTLLQLLEGRCELHLSGWPHEPHLEVVSAPTGATQSKPRSRSGTGRRRQA